MTEGFLQAGGRGFRVLRQGPSDGPLALLLHGFPETAHSWRHQIPALADAGFQVCAPDMRGYGGSHRPTRVADYDLDPLADDVAALIEALGAQRAAVIGHDWGGGVAWHFAQRHPGRLTRLAVLNCPHPRVLLRVMGRSPRQLARSWYMFMFQVPGLADAIIARNPRRFVERAFVGTAANKEAFDDEDLAVYVAAIGQPGAARAALSYYRASFRKGPRAWRARLRAWDVPVAAPTRLIWGLQDTALGQELIDPHGDLVSGPFDVVRIADSGHWVQQEAPEQVNAALLEHLEPCL